MKLKKTGYKYDKVRINGYIGEKKYTLMNKDIPLIDIDETTGEFVLHQENQKYFPYSFKGIIPNFNLFINWGIKRTLLLDRKNSKKLLNACNLPQDDKFQIAKACKFLSVEDCFWIKENVGEKWDDINLRENHLSSAIAQIALDGSDVTISGDVETAEFTVSGYFPKAWIRDETGLYLHKKSGFDYESEKEVLSSEILDILNVPHINYSLVADGLCKCKCMVNEEISRLTYREYSVYCDNNNIDPLNIFNTKFNEYFCKMAIIDYVIANVDRHSGNWGFFIDNFTGEIIGPHPQFDHNLSFDSTFSDSTKYIPFPEVTNFELAKEAMSEYPLNIKDILDIPKERFLDLGIQYDKLVARINNITPKIYFVNNNNENTSDNELDERE